MNQRVVYVHLIVAKALLLKVMENTYTEYTYFFQFDLALNGLLNVLIL